MKQADQTVLRIGSGVIRGNDGVMKVIGYRYHKSIDGHCHQGDPIKLVEATCSRSVVGEEFTAAVEGIM